MAVHSNPMGSARLTGRDVQAFLQRASASAAPDTRAQTSAVRGRKLLEQLAEQGFAVLRARPTR
jgi:hypothetical protein